MAQCPVCGETRFGGYDHCPACGHPYPDGGGGGRDDEDEDDDEDADLD